MTSQGSLTCRCKPRLWGTAQAGPCHPSNLTSHYPLSWPHSSSPLGCDHLSLCLTVSIRKPPYTTLSMLAPPTPSSPMILTTTWKKRCVCACVWVCVGMCVTVCVYFLGRCQLAPSTRIWVPWQQEPHFPPLYPVHSVLKEVAVWLCAQALTSVLKMKQKSSTHSICVQHI
jgi:hypothetical protein